MNDIRVYPRLVTVRDVVSLTVTIIDSNNIVRMDDKDNVSTLLTPSLSNIEWYSYHVVVYYFSITLIIIPTETRPIKFSLTKHQRV